MAAMDKSQLEQMKMYDEMNACVPGVLGFTTEGGRPLPEGPLRVEVANVAAAVSRLHASTRLVYEKLSAKTFKIVRRGDGLPSAGNSFVKNKQTDEQQRDDYWMLTRCKNCSGLSAVLIILLQRLADMGVTLMHDGKRVTNFGVVNGPIDVETPGLPHTETTRGVVLEVDGMKGEKIPLMQTHKKSKLISKLSPAQQQLFPGAGYQSPMDVQYAHREEAQAFGLQNEYSTVSHHWTILELETGETVHIDLCGPSYGVFEYVLAGGVEVPVSVRVLAKDAVSLTPKSLFGSFRCHDKETGILLNEHTGEPLKNSGGVYNYNMYLNDLFHHADRAALEWPPFSCLRKQALAGGVDAVTMMRSPSSSFFHLWPDAGLGALQMAICGVQRAVKNRVTGKGLKSATAQRLNGKQGVVVDRGAGEIRGWAVASDDFDARWEVRFTGEEKPVKIKPENLCLGWPRELPAGVPQYGPWEMKMPAQGGS